MNRTASSSSISDFISLELPNAVFKTARNANSIIAGMAIRFLERNGCRETPGQDAPLVLQTGHGCGHEPDVRPRPPATG